MVWFIQGSIQLKLIVQVQGLVLKKKKFNAYCIQQIRTNTRKPIIKYSRPTFGNVDQ